MSIMEYSKQLVTIGKWKEKHKLFDVRNMGFHKIGKNKFLTGIQS